MFTSATNSVAPSVTLGYFSRHTKKTLAKSKSTTDLIRLKKVVPDTCLQTSVEIEANSHFNTPRMRGVYYRRYGGGPLEGMVMIMPGTGQTAQTYDQQARTLVNQSDQSLGVLVCNKMGHGDSDGPRGVFQSQLQVIGMMQLYVEAARILTNHSSFEANHAQKVSLLLFGQSLGGLLVLDALSEFGAKLAIEWHKVSCIVHNPWLSLRQERQPADWQKSVMDCMASLNKNAVVCRSGSLWNSLYFSFISASLTQDEHALVGINAMKVVHHLGVRLQESAEHIHHDITIVLSPEDELIDPQATLKAFNANPFVRILQWHSTTGANHNQNKTAVGALVLSNLIGAQLFGTKERHFLLEPVINDV